MHEIAIIEIPFNKDHIDFMGQTAILDPINSFAHKRCKMHYLCAALQMTKIFRSYRFSYMKIPFTYFGELSPFTHFVKSSC